MVIGDSDNDMGDGDTKNGAPGRGAGESTVVSPPFQLKSDELLAEAELVMDGRAEEQSDVVKLSMDAEWYRRDDSDWESLVLVLANNIALT